MRFCRSFIVFINLLFPVLCSAQFTDDFSDGDFTNNPTWSGDTAVFAITAGEFQLNAPPMQAESYASLPSLSIENAQWEFYLRMDFNPSSTNNARIYLTANNPVLTGALNGYYVRVGGLNDDISLWRQDGSATTEILTGSAGSVDFNQVNVRVRVTRDVLGNWEVLRDTTGGNTFISEGTVLDNTHFSSQHFGVLCDYTSTRSDKFFFDDFSVSGQPYTDLTPPVIDSVAVISQSELDVFFNEEVDAATAQTVGNYVVNNGVGSPTSAQVDVVLNSLVHLTFGNNFPNATNSILTTSNVTDTAGNVLVTTNDTFLYYNAVVPQPGDVIITEIFADFSPANGLPAAEYIEIYNASSSIYNLENWIFTDASAVAGSLPQDFLFPGDYLVICQNTNLPLFSAIPNTIGIGPFPTLNNGGDNLQLLSNNGTLIDQVNYDISWYNDPSKDDGGWSLELINPLAVCAAGASNWSASNNPSGGTPGIQNSIFSIAPDITAPELIDLNLNSTTSISIEFNEAMDSASVVNAANYNFTPGLTVGSISALAPEFSQVTINLTTAIDSTLSYNLTVTGVTDCPGNTIGSVNTAGFAIGATPQPGDIIFTEIYNDFLPSNGLPLADYVEIYNTTSSIFNLDGFTFTDASTLVGVFDSYIIQPGEYVILCSQGDTTDFQPYGNYIGLQPFPTINNDFDNLILTDSLGNVIDQIAYDDTWYQDPAKEDGGWSLELINPQAICASSASNWIGSNAATGGTPGAQNSVFDLTPDTDAPELTDVTVTSQSSVILSFNENMDSLSLVNGSYNFTPALTISNITSFGPNFDEVEIVFTTPLDSSISYSLDISNVTDCPGNPIGSVNSAIFAIGATPAPGDVIITEIFADFSPAVQLPSSEFVEIYNNSSELFNLKDWVYTDASTSNAVFDDYLLFPGDYVILCHRDDTAQFSSFGDVIGLFPFPGLNNNFDDLQLIDPSGVTINQVAYSSEWYNNPAKEDGGWTLELINPQAVCLGSPGNWTASTDAAGGTPGVQNSVYDLTPDTDSPSLVRAEVINQNELLITFDEAMDSTSVVNATYDFTPALTVSAVEAFPPLYNEASITFTTNIDSVTIYSMEVTNVVDCPGNAIGPFNVADFAIGVEPQLGDLIINELYPEPDTLESPNLPNGEFIELHNTSSQAVRTTNLFISDGTNTAQIPTAVIEPGGYLILCDDDFEAEYSLFGNTLGFASIPSLNNTGEFISLRNDTGGVLDGVLYDKTTYQNANRSEGGYTLERINPEDPCGGSINWRASEAPNHGTPASINSVYNPNFGTAEPEIEAVVIENIDLIEVFFTKDMDSASLANATYTLSPTGIATIVRVDPVGPDYNSVTVAFDTTNIAQGVVFTLTIDNAADCAGNPMATFNFADFEIPNERDIIINEVLFNPIGEGSDYVELYNRSDKTVNIQGWALAFENSSGGISYNTITEQLTELGPEEFILLCEDDRNIEFRYPQNSDEDVFLEMDLPTYSNTSGNVRLVSSLRTEVDEFTYSEDFHFPLLESQEGVSLERINYDRATQDRTNWHSAAEDAGFGTPGVENSQYKSAGYRSSEITLPDNTFSPDGDGFEDILNINYKFEAPGYVANVRIFDSEGREIRQIANNQLLALEGTFAWDGITSENEKARVGLYVIFVEVFDLNGDKKLYKETCVLATRF